MNSRIHLAWVCLGLTACAGPQEVMRTPPRAPTGLELAPAVDEVQTIQLYAERENVLPMVRLGGGPPLTLEFDLMGNNLRPLSIYFYHANSQWQRDLTASEYLGAFRRDDLFDYQMSRGTQLPYAHYIYTFPNDEIFFRLSGNYILRVTEQGDEDEVLFERPFYVAEDLGIVGMDLQRLFAGGTAMPSIQPIIRFAPPPQQTGGVFDYRVCFIRNGQHEAPRCSQRPSLTMQPDLLFYLEPEDSFRLQEGSYYVDLRHLRPAGQIESIAFNTSPHEVVLQPNYARFPSTDADPRLNGQSMIAGTYATAGDPDTRGEYVQVHFSFVPPNETRLGGGLYIAGSFNGWSIDLGKQLRWNTAERRYEGSLLLKQGEHEYQFTSPDPGTRRALHVRLPRPDNLFTALVYYRDVLHGTDRLLAYRHAFSE